MKFQARLCLLSGVPFFERLNWGLGADSTLMRDVMLLVLWGGWYSQWGESGRKDIESQIHLSGLENLLVDVPQEEIDLFMHDLRILRILP